MHILIQTAEITLALVDDVDMQYLLQYATGDDDGPSADSIAHHMSKNSWVLHFSVCRDQMIDPCGIITLSADRFSEYGTVQTATWLVPYQRGLRLGIGQAARTAVLAFAFDTLNATAADTISDPTNAAVRAINKNLGYEIVEETPSKLHCRLTRANAPTVQHGVTIDQSVKDMLMGNYSSSMADLIRCTSRSIPSIAASIAQILLLSSFS